MSSLEVAVVGAGAAGLVTARELVRHGHRVTVFEQGKRVGGVWVYSPDTELDPLGQHGLRIHGSLYDSLRTNLPRDLMAFTDYPFDSSGGGDDAWPRFPGHAAVLVYLESFARDFDVMRHIRFGNRVASVRPGVRWAVETVADGTCRVEHFDAVAVCNGHYAEPRVPALPGLDVWPGRLVHSHNYREPSPFRGRRVALLGASASALDLSAEIASVAESVCWCAAAFATLPHRARTAGNLRRLPGIESLRADGTIVLQDGRSLDDADTLVFCTGYHYRFPFLDADLLEVADNRVGSLYRDLLHVDHPTLAFIGIPFRVVPFPLFEVQAGWFSRLLAGAFDLPPAEDMHREIADRAETLRAAGVLQRHFHQRRLDCYDYLDALSDQCGGPRLPEWHRQLTAALLAHVAAFPGAYRERPLARFAPTRITTPGAVSR